MTDFRVSNEGLRFLDADHELAAPSKLPLWRGDHFPSVSELRNIVITQPTTEELEATSGMANIHEVAEKIAPEEFVPGAYWGMLLVEKRRASKIGWRVLGTFWPEDVMTDEEELQLRTYWRHSHSLPKSQEYKDTVRKTYLRFGALILGSGVLVAGMESCSHLVNGH